jgi:hypothetical protein
MIARRLDSSVVSEVDVLSELRQRNTGIGQNRESSLPKTGTRVG